MIGILIEANWDRDVPASHFSAARIDYQISYNHCDFGEERKQDKLTVRPEFPPIVFFDLEGTLLQKDVPLDNGKVAPSAWTVLAKRLGERCLAEEELTKDRWNSGGYPGYVEWMRDTVRIHQKYGLTKQVFDDVMESVQLTPGVEDVFNDLRASGTITAIVSGGFKALGDRVQRTLRVDHSICA